MHFFAVDQYTSKQPYMDDIHPNLYINTMTEGKMRFQILLQKIVLLEKVVGFREQQF